MMSHDEDDASAFDAQMKYYDDDDASTRDAQMPSHDDALTFDAQIIVLR